MTAFAVVGAGTVVVLVCSARRAGATVRVAGLRRAVEAGSDPGRRARWLGPRLAAAGLEVDPATALGAWLGAVVLAAGVGGAASPVVGLLSAGGALVAGPAGLALARARVERRRAAELPEVLERVASELRAGGTVAEAVAALGAAPGPLHHDLRAVSRAIDRGASLVDALGGWARRSRVEGAREAAGGLAVVARLGGAAAPALEGLAAALRDRLGAAEESRSQSSQARMSAWVVGAAPLAYLAFASVADPGSTSMLLTTTAGRVCLAGGLLLEGAGAVWMRHIVAGGGR
ncbi:MAG: type II secretion system F family protein [Acidimicrobiia bacterium]|nr:type II secretion system F family protein [Acidimicrobiia bacterium]